GGADAAARHALHGTDADRRPEQDRPHRRAGHARLLERRQRHEEEDEADRVEREDAPQARREGLLRRAAHSSSPSATPNSRSSRSTRLASNQLISRYTMGAPCAHTQKANGQPKKSKSR